MGKETLEIVEALLSTSIVENMMFIGSFRANSQEIKDFLEPLKDPLQVIKNCEPY